MTCENEVNNTLKQGSTLKDEICVVSCQPDPNCPEQTIETPIDISGWGVEVNVNTTGPNATNLAQLTDGNGLTIDAPNGKISINAPTTTYPLETVAYDAKLTDLDGCVMHTETVFIEMVKSETV